MGDGAVAALGLVPVGVGVGPAPGPWMQNTRQGLVVVSRPKGVFKDSKMQVYDSDGVARARS